jgi:hypothetical protein
MTDSVRAQLDIIAQLNDRSVTDEVRNALEYWIEIIALSQANYGAPQPTAAAVPKSETTVAAATVALQNGAPPLAATKPDPSAPVGRIGRKKRGDL